MREYESGAQAAIISQLINYLWGIKRAQNQRPLFVTLWSQKQREGWRGGRGGGGGDGIWSTRKVFLFTNVWEADTQESFPWWHEHWNKIQNWDLTQIIWMPPTQFSSHDDFFSVSIFIHYFYCCVFYCSKCILRTHWLSGLWACCSQNDEMRFMRLNIIFSLLHNHRHRESVWPHHDGIDGMLLTPFSLNLNPEYCALL